MSNNKRLCAIVLILIAVGAFAGCSSTDEFFAAADAAEKGAEAPPSQGGATSNPGMDHDRQVSVAQN